MYNRYIPQNDGSFQKRSVAEQPRQQNTGNTRPPPPAPVQQTDVPAQRPIQHGSPMGFLKNLLPKNFDTGDLIIVLLLLLMAGDCEEDQNTALLTLALYFFM